MKLFKKIFRIFLLVLVLTVFIGTAVYLYMKSHEEPVVYKTDTPFFTDIIKKTVATGSIVPRKEIAIKPRVSGIIEELYVESGQRIRSGQLIAKIRIIPNMVNLNNAESTVNRSDINLQETQKTHDRQEKLYKDGVIGEAEYIQSQTKLKLAKEERESAENNLDLVKQGASKKSGQVSNLVYATADGIVLDIPVKKGASVIESNNFNEGTTIASIADMSDLMFKGNIDESETGKLREGMDINIIIAALEGQVFKAKLDYISPKGVDVQGSIQFEIRASIKENKGSRIRAGYSANADIVIAERKHVLAVKESNVIFNKDSSFVEIEKQIQVFEKRPIKTGLSDGINIEITEGLKAEDKIKMQEQKAGGMSGGGEGGAVVVTVAQ